MYIITVEDANGAVLEKSGMSSIASPSMESAVHGSGLADVGSLTTMITSVTLETKIPVGSYPRMEPSSPEEYVFAHVASFTPPVQTISVIPIYPSGDPNADPVSYTLVYSHTRGLFGNTPSFNTEPATHSSPDPNDPTA